MFRLSSFNKNWIYSIVSLLNVACGVSVTALIWYKYSASEQSDVLLLATSSISILSQLSLVGVEQILYFYSDEKKRSGDDSFMFFNLAFTWALVSGALFAAVVVASSKYFLMLIAVGFSDGSQELARHLLVCLSPQIVVTPALHVLKAKWSLEGRFGAAYLLSAVNSLVLLACLIFSILLKFTSLENFGELSLVITFGFGCWFIFYNRAHLVKPSLDAWRQVRCMAVNSFMIKGANAMHNFLVQALISSILSKMPAGSLSIYQYAKRLADGVFAITAGPQVMIYHAKCAKAVSHWNTSEMVHNAKAFLKSFLGFFVTMAILVYLVTPFALALVAKTFTESSIDDIRLAYVGIVIWYLIMGIETLSVGIILATHSSLTLFGVNFSFIFLFFLWSRVHNIEKVLELVFTTSGFQVISFCLFSLSALLIARRRCLRAS